MLLRNDFIFILTDPSTSWKVSKLYCFTLFKIQQGQGEVRSVSLLGFRPHHTQVLCLCRFFPQRIENLLLIVFYLNSVQVKKGRTFGTGVEGGTFVTSRELCGVGSRPWRGVATRQWIGSSSRLRAGGWAQSADNRR